MLFLRNLNESLSAEKNMKENQHDALPPTTPSTNKAASGANPSGHRGDGPAPGARGWPGPAGGRRPTPAAALDADGMGGSFSRSFSFSPSSSSSPSSSPPSSTDGAAALPCFSSAPGGSPAPGPGERSAAAVAAGGLCSDMAPLPAATRLSPQGSPRRHPSTRAPFFFSSSSSSLPPPPSPSEEPRGHPQRRRSAPRQCSSRAAPGRSDTPARRGGARPCRPRRGPGEEGEARDPAARRRPAPPDPAALAPPQPPRHLQTAGRKRGCGRHVVCRRLIETRLATGGAARGQRRTRLRKLRSAGEAAVPARRRRAYGNRGCPPRPAQPRWRGANAALRCAARRGAAGRGVLRSPGRGLTAGLRGWRGRPAAVTFAHPREAMLSPAGISRLPAKLCTPRPPQEAGPGHGNE